MIIRKGYRIFQSHRLRKLCSAPSGHSLKEMREKVKKKVLEIYLNASPLLAFLSPSFIDIKMIKSWSDELQTEIAGLSSSDETLPAKKQLLTTLLATLEKAVKNAPTSGSKLHGRLSRDFPNQSKNSH